MRGRRASSVRVRRKTISRRRRVPLAALVSGLATIGFAGQAVEAAMLRFVGGAVLWFVIGTAAFFIGLRVENLKFEAPG